MDKLAWGHQLSTCPSLWTQVPPTINVCANKRVHGVDCHIKKHWQKLPFRINATFPLFFTKKDEFLCV